MDSDRDKGGAGGRVDTDVVLPLRFLPSAPAPGSLLGSLARAAYTEGQLSGCFALG